MLMPHIARHPARYLGTREEKSGRRVAIGRLTEPGDCTLWLDEGGIHFDRPGNGGAFLLPRRCLIRAQIRRIMFRTVVDVWWNGAHDEVWISRFTARRREPWRTAVESLRTDG